MKKSKTGFAVCLGIAVLSALYMLFFVDPATGFVAMGPLWAAYLPAALGLAAVLVTSRGVASCPAAFEGKKTALSTAMLPTAALLAAAGGASIPAALDYLSDPLMTVQGILTMTQAVLLFTTALWFLVRGLHALGREEPALPGAWPAVLGWLGLVAVLVMRFVLAPAALARVGVVIGVLSAAAAVLFFAAVAKIFCLPGSPCGRNAFTGGMLSFLYGTCGEAPRALRAALAGSGSLLQTLLGLTYGLMGVCGLICAFYAAGEAANPEKKPKAPGQGARA